MTTLLQRAKFELRAASLFDEGSDYNGDLGVQVTALMETFCAYGHSGGSATATVALFVRLAQGKPLTPLTGEDSEWGPELDDDVNPKGAQQNLRYAPVFRLKTNTHAWDVANRHRPVMFPYTVS